MNDSIAVFRGPQPYISRVPIDRPWIWLAAGWRDLWAAPGISLAWGLLPVVTGWLASALLLWLDLPFLVLPLSAGFFFVGPFVAVGLYEVSRRLEANHMIDGESTLLAWRRNAEQIAASLKRRGVEARLLETPGAPPAVYGERLARGARRTVLVYAHYEVDGQENSRAGD